MSYGTYVIKILPNVKLSAMPAKSLIDASTSNHAARLVAETLFTVRVATDRDIAECRYLDNESSVFL